MSSKTSTLYSCKIWFSSTDLKYLRSWVLLLPLTKDFTGLPTKINRFTLFRSPLGNKKAKDQFERREYKGFLSLDYNKPEKILMLLDLLGRFNVIKSKVLVEASPMRA